jgi:hypothetical protein
MCDTGGALHDGRSVWPDGRGEDSAVGRRGEKGQHRYWGEIGALRLDIPTKNRSIKHKGISSRSLTRNAAVLSK